MSAERNPAPDNAKTDLVMQFRREYGSALNDAAISAEHTKTEGWQALYTSHHAHDRERRRDMAKRLKALAGQLEDFGIDEDGEKSIKEIVKENSELRDRNAAFEAQVIEKVCAPVKACEGIALKYRTTAARDESAAPMHNIGLEQLMIAEINKQPKPVFDLEIGTVEIREPK